jgi:hypothetical protein
MTDNASIRAWYASTQRLLELLDVTLLPPQILYALQSPNPASSKVILANLLGPQLLAFLRKEQIHPFYRLVAQDRLTPGVRFTYQGHFYGKGFGAANRTPLVSLSENVNEILPGKKLLIEFSKSGLITDTAYSRLSGSTNLFAFCSVTEVEDELVRAVPYLIGDLVERTSSGIDLRLADNLSLPVQNIDQFKNVDFQWNPSKAEFNRLRDIPEKQVKELFCSLLSEADVPKDWGGEETDIFSSNLTVEGKRCSAAFLLKGPANFHEMTPADCGKNGDQIYRLFNTPADVFVLQHCHKVTPAVRKTMEAFALSQYSRSCMYTIIDGYDTARILHSHGIL